MNLNYNLFNLFFLNISLSKPSQITIIFYTFIFLEVQIMFNLFSEDNARKEERLRILELKIERLEKLQRDPEDPYVPNPAGICWHYHEVTSDGKIIEKR